MAIEARIQGVGTIKRIAIPFDKAIAQFNQEGRDLISARDLAYSRQSRGPEKSLSTNGSYVKEGLIYVQDKTLVVRESPLMDLREAKKAVQAHRQGSEFYCDDLAGKQLKIAEADLSRPIEERRVFMDNRRGNFNIKVEDIPNDELFKYLLLDQSKSYPEFLSESKISEVPVYFSSNDEKSFGNQLWFGRLDSQSSLVGSDRDLDDSDDVRGVNASSTRGVAKHNKKISSISYTQKQITNALNDLKLSGLRKILLTKLKE